MGLERSLQPAGPYCVLDDVEDFEELLDAIKRGVVGPRYSPWGLYFWPTANTTLG
jgi:hypothetical protein